LFPWAAALEGLAGAESMAHAWVEEGLDVSLRFFESQVAEVSEAFGGKFARPDTLFAGSEAAAGLCLGRAVFGTGSRDSLGPDQSVALERAL
jgi:hypothetical protein